VKSKFYKLIGVALTVVLLASLTVGLAGVPAGAASSNLKFVKFEMPRVEEYDFASIDHGDFAASEGDFWCTPGVTSGPIAQTPDGGIMFAAVSGGGWQDVLKSTDGGYSWIATGFYDRWLDYNSATPGNQTDNSPIVDIVSSPDYAEDTSIFVATVRFVYQSVDGGKNFICMDTAPVWTDENITDLDVSLDDRGRLAYMVGTAVGVQDELNGAIDDTVTTITVVDATIFPASGVIRIQNELIGYTGTTATTFTGCDRGIYETTAAPHVDATAVTGVGDVYVLSTDTGLAWQPQGIGYDALASSFSPYYGDDESIFAVVTDPTIGSEKTRVRTSVAYVGTTDPWNGWAKDIGDAKIQNAWVEDFTADGACIGFPDDFDPFGIGNNVCWVGIDGWDLAAPSEKAGDVYKVQVGDPSRATDLDIRGVTTTLVPTATQIYSIDVSGDTEDAWIMVGTDYLQRVYRSEDGGAAWKRTGKELTGAKAQVMMTPGFLTSNVAYASTTGGGASAFQKSVDGGNTWNQISIIDYGSMDIPTIDDNSTPTDKSDDFVSSVVEDAPGYSITGMDAYGYASDGTLYIITQTAQTYTTSDPGNITADNYYGALWGRLDGKHWERMFSYANGQVTDTLKKIKVLGDGSAMFAQDINSLKIWRSTDMGATFPKKITTKTALATVAFVSSTTYYTGHGDGNVYWSTKSGVAWTPPDDSEISAPIINVSVKGDVVIIGAVGGVFSSNDGGKTIERVGKTGPFGGATIAGSSGDTLYAVSPGGAKVMRTVVDLGNPRDAEWEQIDDNQGSSPAYNNANFTAGGPALALPPSGILYVVDGTAVNTDYASATPANAGGLWRCTDPTAKAPYFERETKNLNGGEKLGFLCPSLAAPPTLAPTIFFQDKVATNYYDQVWIFTDTLNTGVPLAVPEADETGVGLLPEGFVYPEVTLFWQEMTGATSYQYQAAIDASFKTKIASEFTTSLASKTMKLNPNTTYYWRVRVADEGSLIGAPLISPWSEVRKFKTAIGASMARPDLQAPWPGEPDVPLSPTFEWSGIEWAEVYEYELAVDPTTTAGGYFATPLVALVGTDSLVSTAWKCDATLDYTTRYYWHVKAIGVDTDTPWSDVGTFTTMSKAPPPVEPGGDIVIPPVQEITPAWIWAIVIIGAILVIAVIVLIVTTRRVP